jgi:outer membrane murein-binding lipoprotein Lpp
MTIYEIDQEIMNLLEMIDEETGEALFDPEQIEQLQMERERKVENLALAFKNLTAEAKAIRDEIENLTKRAKATQNEADRAKAYLELVLGGEAFKTAKVAVSYRKSESVEPAPGFMDWALANDDSLIRYKEPEADKTAIKKALKDGRKIPFVNLVTKTSMTIK